MPAPWQLFRSWQSNRPHVQLSRRERGRLSITVSQSVYQESIAGAGLQLFAAYFSPLSLIRNRRTVVNGLDSDWQYRIFGDCRCGAGKGGIPLETGRSIFAASGEFCAITPTRAFNL